MWWSAIGLANRSKSAGKTRNTEHIVCRWQNDRKRGQPARYMCRQGTSSVVTQDVAPTCAHLTALARTFSSRQLAMGGNLRRWWNTGIYVNGGERSGSRVPLVVRERCDNDDATFESITFSYIRISCGIYDMGASWQPWCLPRGSRGRSLLGRASRRALRQWRPFDNFRSYILGGRVAVIGEAEVAACRCRSREHS